MCLAEWHLGYIGIERNKSQSEGSLESEDDPQDDVVSEKTLWDSEEDKIWMIVCITFYLSFVCFL